VALSDKRKAVGEINALHCCGKVW